MTLTYENGTELEVQVKIGCNEESKKLARDLMDYLMCSVELYFDVMQGRPLGEEDEDEGCYGDMYM